MVEPMFVGSFLAKPLVGEQVRLGGSEGKHAASVRRMRVGEAIALTDGKGMRVRGVVASVGDKDLNVEITEVIQDALPELQITLVQALAKGDRDELAIQAATELGAVAIIPWQAERSISRWDAAKAAKGKSRWQVICEEAAKQSLRSYFPVVHSMVTTGQLQALLSEFDQVLILDPYAETGLAQLSVQTGRIALVVGPEGGIEPAEIDALVKSGARSVRLGDGILRTSTAGIAAIAAILTRSGYYN